jgi:hypothetical protein
MADPPAQPPFYTLQSLEIRVRMCLFAVVILLQASLLCVSCPLVKVHCCTSSPGPTTQPCCCTPASGVVCTAVTCAVPRTPGTFPLRPALALCPRWWLTHRGSTGWRRAPAGAGWACGMCASCCVSTAGSTHRGKGLAAAGTGSNNKNHASRRDTMSCQVVNAVCTCKMRHAACPHFWGWYTVVHCSNNFETHCSMQP